MVTKEYIAGRLKELSFDPTVLEQYSEPHRFYHRIDHICDVLDKIPDHHTNHELFLAAVFHDIVYDPTSLNNEENSAEFFMNASEKSKLKPTSKNAIKQIILDTKYHEPSNSDSAKLIEADLSVFEQPFEKLLQYEHNIFKEFQFVDFSIYRPKRIAVLQHFNKNGKLDALIDYVKYYQPRIGVFAGSFNPFHKGHYNVLKKAERIFDKIIIAFGKNPEKSDRHWPIPKALKFHQKEEYHGLLTDFIGNFNYDVTVIRGLRNSTDFQYEQNQYRYIQELMPGIKIINIFCDKEFEHISSSGIRVLEKYNKHKQYILD